jgi:disulfide bond formation protein DsbB
MIPSVIGATRPFFLLVFAACAGALALALAGQYVFGLEPCILCLQERLPLAAGGVIALAMVALPTSARLRRLALGLLVLAFAGNALLAGYHVGVEQHWWESPGCTAEDTAAAAASLQDLLAAARQPGRPPCDQPQWALFGLTLAAYNGLFNLALAALAALALGRDMRRPRR